MLTVDNPPKAEWYISYGAWRYAGIGQSVQYGFIGLQDQDKIQGELIMAKRNRYRIVITFTYSNGKTGGILDTTVNSKKAIDVQLEANRRWLKSKGHVLVTTSISQCTQ